MKNERKNLAICFVGLLIISGSSVNTQTLKQKSVQEKIENAPAIGLNVLSNNLDFVGILTNPNGEMIPLSISGNGKDQSCENGNSFYELHWTSQYVAQGFKPTMNLFTYLYLYLKKSSSVSTSIYYLVLIRNDSVDGENWLGGFGIVDDLSTSGEWVTFECVEPFEVIPGNTYYIVISLLTSLGSDKSMSWRYGTGNPYSRGVAYHSENNGENWQQEGNWDFNFQTWGISTNPPNPPSCKSPSDGATGVDINADLSWACNDPDGDSLSYDIYFGTSTPPSLVVSNHPNTYYDPGTLYYDTLYYWQIVARDSNGAEKQGIIWHFTTKSAPPGPPVINYVETYYADGSEASDGKGLLLQGLALENTYKAFISGSNVDKVEFTFEFMPPGYQIVTDNYGADGWTATINTSYILNPFASYKIRAHNDKGWGDYKTYDPKIVPIVGWLTQYIKTLSENKSLDFVTFEIGEKEPKRPINNFWTLEGACQL
ncbi:MAG: hypothetical protein QHH19_03845 [Candidatus Thermoplasmatota archaeon]|jgi:hypothetical protein|nr:hypothetical protein [Candidatus Thermoplasmatota archaeon]